MEWKRSTMQVRASRRVARLTGMVPTITLRSRQRTGPLRLGLWIGNHRLAGWTVPFLPPNILFTIRRGQASARVNGQVRDLGAHLLHWDGQRAPSDVVLPHAPFTLTLDQEVDSVVPVLVDVSLRSVEEI